MSTQKKTMSGSQPEKFSSRGGLPRLILDLQEGRWTALWYIRQAGRERCGRGGGVARPQRCCWLPLACSNVLSWPSRYATHALLLAEGRGCLRLSWVNDTSGAVQGTDHRQRQRVLNSVWDPDPSHPSASLQQQTPRGSEQVFDGVVDSERRCVRCRGKNAVPRAPRFSPA